MELATILTICLILSFRTPDHVDEPVEPTKLLRVQRIKPVKGNPYWEKQILHQYGLAGDVRALLLFYFNVGLINLLK